MKTINTSGRTISKVAFIINSRDIGGTEKRYTRLWRYFRYELNIDADLLINYSLLAKLDTIGLANLSDEGIRILGLRWQYKYDGNLIDRAFSVMKEAVDITISHIQSRYFISRTDRYDVVHGILGGIRYLSNFNETTGKVFSYQDSLYAIMGSLKKSFYKRAFEKRYFVNVASKTLMKRLLEEGLVNYGNIFVDPCTFADYSGIHLNGKENWVVFAGRTSEEKNPFLFLEAAKKVCQIREDIRFFLLGRGPLDPEIMKYLEENRLHRFVTHKFANDPVEILQKSLVFVSLQKYENYHSQALLEGMACGNAIIATDVGETGLHITDKTGILIKPDSEELKNAINYLLDNRQNAIERGHNARKEVLEKFTIERYSDFILEIYRKAIHDRRQNRQIK